MSVYKYIILGWFAFSLIALTLSIGKQRKPNTPATAVTALVIYGALAALVVLA